MQELLGCAGQLQLLRRAAEVSPCCKDLLLGGLLVKAHEDRSGVAVGDGNTEALCGDDGLLGIDDPVALDVAPQLQRLLLALLFLAADVGDDVVHQGMQGGHIALQAAIGLDGDEAALGAQTLALRRDDLNVVGVDLRHHHRDIRGAAVGAVVGDDRALCLGISLLKCLDLSLGHIDGTEDEVHLRSDLFHLGSVQHDHLLHAFGHRCGHGPAGTDSLLIGLACTAAGCGQGGQFEPGVILQQCDEALTDHASRTDNANFILFFHFQHLSFQKNEIHTERRLANRTPMQYNRYCLYRFYDNIDTTFVSIIGKANAKHVKKRFLV